MFVGNNCKHGSGVATLDRSHLPSGNLVFRSFFFILRIVAASALLVVSAQSRRIAALIAFRMCVSTKGDAATRISSTKPTCTAACAQ